MADATGLIHGMILDGHASATSVSWSDIRAWTADSGVLWVHLDRTDETAQRWMREEAGLDETIADALLSSSTRPHCVDHDEGLLLTLRGVNLNPGADPEDMVSLRVWAEPRRVITLRRERLMAVADVVQQLERGKGPRDTGELVTRITLRLTERMGPIVDEIAETLDALEDRIVESERNTTRDELNPLRREIIALHRFLGPQRVALTTLGDIESSLLDDDDRAALGQIANRVHRYLDDLVTARERALVLQEEIATHLAGQLNSRIYVLTVIAAIVLPLTLFAGLLGMNVGGIPLAESKWGLTIVTVGLAALGLLFAVLLRRLKWL